MAKTKKTIANKTNLKPRSLRAAVVHSLRVAVYAHRLAVQRLCAELQRTRAALCVEMSKVDNWVRQQDRAKTREGRRHSRILNRIEGHNQDKVDWNDQQLHKLRSAQAEFRKLRSAGF